MIEVRILDWYKWIMIYDIDAGIGSRTAEFTLVESPTVDDRLSNKGLKSSGSLKQEIDTYSFL